MELFIYVLCMYGLTNLLVYGSGPFDIISKFRDWCNQKIPMVGNMLDCMMCTSTNIGWCFSLLNILFLPQILFTPFMYLLGGMTQYWYIIIPLDACFTSGAVWLLHTFQEMCEIIANNFSNKSNNSDE